MQKKAPPPPPPRQNKQPLSHSDKSSGEKPADRKESAEEGTRQEEQQKQTNKRSAEDAFLDTLFLEDSTISQQKNQEEKAETHQTNTANYDLCSQQYGYYDPSNYGFSYDNSGYYAGLSNIDYNSYFYQQQSFPQSIPAQFDQVAPSLPASSNKPTRRKEKKTNTDSDIKVDFRLLPKDAVLRSAGGEVWMDPTLNEWDPNDFRLFVGNLGPDVHDQTLREAFQKYPSYVKSRVVRDVRTNRSKGYGFVSFKNPDDFSKAFHDYNGAYIGNRPVKISKANSHERNVTVKEAKKVAREGLYEIIAKGDL